MHPIHTPGPAADRAAARALRSAAPLAALTLAALALAACANDTAPVEPTGATSVAGAAAAPPGPGGAPTIAFSAGDVGVTETAADGRFNVAVNDPPGDNPAELVVAAPGFVATWLEVEHSTSKHLDVCLVASR